MAHALRRPETSTRGNLPSVPRVRPSTKSVPTESWTLLRQLSKACHSTNQRASVTMTKAVMNEAAGIAGGYTVPKGFSDRLFRYFGERTILYRYGLRVPLNTLSTELPVPDMTTVQSAGVSPFGGGLSLAWVPVGGTTDLTATEPTFKQVGLTAWTLIGKLQISNQLLQDMGEEGEYRLTRLMARACGWQVDYAFFQGLGASASMPLGILKAPCALAVNRAGAGHIAQADPAAMVAALLPGSWSTAIWCCSPTAIGDVVKITGYQANTYPGLLRRGQMGWLLSRPLFVTEKLPALGTAGDLVLVDPEMYVVGRRSEITIEASNQEPGAFVRNRTIFRTYVRCDGKPLLNTFVTTQDAATQVSSVVVLT